MIVMLKAILRHIDVEKPFLHQQNCHGTADVLLHDAISLIIAFLAMLRSDEVFVNKTHTHGILQPPIVLEARQARLALCTSPDHRSYQLAYLPKPLCQSSMGIRIRREDRLVDSTPVRSLAGMQRKSSVMPSVSAY